MIIADPTPRQSAALQAACDAHNAANRSTLTAADFAALVLGRELDGFAASLRVGLITPYEFVERFQRQGVYDAIYALAQTDAQVAGYLAMLRAKADDVNLFSPSVAQGLAYLVSVGVITQAQSDIIGATS